MSVTVSRAGLKASGLSSEVRPLATGHLSGTDTDTSSPVPQMCQAWTVVSVTGSQFQVLGQAAVRHVKSDMVPAV